MIRDGVERNLRLLGQVMQRSNSAKKYRPEVAPGAAGPCGENVGRNGSESTHDPLAGSQALPAQRASQDARAAEGIVADFLRVGFRIAHDDVVEEFDVDHLCRLSKLAGHLDIGRTRSRVAGGVVVGDHEGRGAGEDRAPEDLTRGCQGGRGRAERNEMPADGVILAVEIDAVERLLHRILVESGAEVIGDFLRSVETDLFAERNEGVNNLGFINAHGESSREPRFPFPTWCRVIAGAARLSARSGWAKVKALGGAPRRRIYPQRGGNGTFARGGDRAAILP